MPRLTVSSPPERRLTGSLRLARLITEVLAPAPIAVVLLVLVAWDSATSTSRGIVAAAIAVLVGTAPPLAYLLWGVRRGHWANHHVPDREHRKSPLLVALVSVLTALALLLILGAGQELVALIGAMIAGLTVSLVISQFWKMSIHAGVTAGTAVILTLIFGAVAGVAWPLVGLVAWSRVKLGDHSAAQVAVGSVVGAAVAGLGFTALRI